MSEAPNRDVVRHRVLTTLRVYAERGETARLALEPDDFDDFEAAMTGRLSALHNFRALDTLARGLRGGGLDLATDPEGQAVWHQTEDTNARLAESIAAARMQLGALLARNASATAYARACHSGVIAPARLVKVG